MPPVPFTAPADPVAAVEARVADLPNVRIPNALATKARTIRQEGPGGATTWTAAETRLILAGVVVLLDQLLDAGLVDVLNRHLATLEAEVDG